MDKNFVILVESDEGNDWGFADTYDEAVDIIANCETVGRYYIFGCTKTSNYYERTDERTLILKYDSANEVYL